MKRILVCGAGGFIGSHLVNRLKSEGHWVRGVDIKHSEFMPSLADEFLLLDLRNQKNCLEATLSIDTIYQLAADMGGAGYIFTGKNDACIMHNSALINLNILECCLSGSIKNIFYSSSACIYPEHNQLDPENPNCEESSAYPANPDSEYGWEKLFSERLYLAYKRNFGLDVKIARFHNVYGPCGTYKGGKEKVPAAMCRKIVESKGEVEVWGDGKQTRSFTYIDDCLEGISKLMNSTFSGPVNIGSDEMISISNLVKLIAKIADKKIDIKNISGPLGVRGRNSDNRLIQEKLGWKPSTSLKEGLTKTYAWISQECSK